MTELTPDWGTKLDARFSKMEQDAKRALRWAERLFGRVGKLEIEVKNLKNDANILFKAKQALEADLATDLISIRALRKAQKELTESVTVLERQMERIGAPQYRVKHCKNGTTLYIQRVRGVPPGDAKLNIEE